jgi:ribokinase
VPHHVAVVGSACVDLAVNVPKLPDSDETVFASPLAILPGGKGLNQATAVARLGGRAALLAKVGDDKWGNFLVRWLSRAGVDTSAVLRMPGVPTAAAIVAVEPDGQSAIILPRSPGTALTAQDVARSEALLRDARVCVVQLEFAPEVVARAVRTATQAGSRVVGTLAPFQQLSPDVWTHLNSVVVNAREAAAVLNVEPSQVLRDPAESVRGLLALGPHSAVVTLGSRGAAFSSDGGGVATTPALPVRAIDTTGAGDAFLGAFALALAHRSTVKAAVAAGIESAAAAVQRPRGSAPAAE